MKKKGKIVSVLLVCCIFTGGGFASGYIFGKKAQSESEKSAMPKTVVEKQPVGSAAESPVPYTSPAAEVKTEKKAPAEIKLREIKKTDKSAADSSWTKVEQTTNVSGVGTVTLYTSAQKDGNEIVWDDTQKWILEISDDNGGYYTLYDQKVTNGSVYYDIAEKDGGEKMINVYTMTGAGTTIMQYNKTNSVYSEKEMYNSGTVNRINTTVPNYK